MAWVRQARQRGVTQVNQWLNPRKTRTGSKSGGSGPGSSARPPSFHAAGDSVGDGLGRQGGHEESLRRTRGDAAGAQLDADPVKRFTVNMGTAITLPAAIRVVRPRERSSSADGVVVGRSPRSSPRTGKPSTWRGQRVRREGLAWQEVAGEYRRFVADGRAGQGASTANPDQAASVGDRRSQPSVR